jgi:hypothetical protein
LSYDVALYEWWGAGKTEKTLPDIIKMTEYQSLGA